MYLQEKQEEIKSISNSIEPDTYVELVCEIATSLMQEKLSVLFTLKFISPMWSNTPQV